MLATLCFAVGGSIGYRRGVQDAVRQLRERRSGNTRCRPMPLSHNRRRPIARLGQRWASQRSRMGARRPAFAHGLGARRRAGARWSPAAVGAAVVVGVLVVPGVAIGATTAQPGERLWHVKRGLERTRLVFAIGADDEVEAHVELAARRLSELNELMSMGDADPQVVAMVSEALGDHTRAADQRLDDVGQTERTALVDRLDDHVERQVAVLDVLMDVDCADSSGPQCVALADAGAASADLAQSAGVVALAEDAPAATGALTEPPDRAVSSSGVAPSEVSAGTVTASEAAAAASDEASSERPPASGTSPSESESSPATTPSAAASAPPEQTPAGRTPPSGGGSGGQEPSGPNTSVTPADPTTTATPAGDGDAGAGIKVDIAP